MARKLSPIERRAQRNRTRLKKAAGGTAQRVPYALLAPGIGNLE